MNPETKIEHRTYGMPDRDIVFPIYRYPRFGYDPSQKLDITTVLIEDRIVMKCAGWWDGKILHRCFRCDKCKTYFFGSSLEDFSHGCNDERLRDIAHCRCGHGEDIGPCASEAERDYKKEIRSRFLCSSCQISRFTREVTNAKQ